VERLEVRWADGTSEAFTIPNVDRRITIAHGTGN
jgi:hypothetical protein